MDFLVEAEGYHKKVLTIGHTEIHRGAHSEVGKKKIGHNLRQNLAVMLR
jgi:hypothetical protein